MSEDTGAPPAMGGFKARPGRWLAPLLLLVLASVTFGIRYWTPASLFWDENYHIPSAQKHIDGVLFMEPHPPLGKMLIALGEVALDRNAERDTSKLLRADHIRQADLPPGYSFAGMRLLPTLAMIAAVLLCYATLLLITGRRLLAFVFAALPALDNAFVVHARSAMLESLQLCFALGAICALAWCLRPARRVALADYLVLGTLVGLTIAVKVNGTVLLLLAPVIYFADRWRELRERRWRPAMVRLAAAVPAFCLPVLLVFFGSFYLHIATATDVVPGRTYKASPAYLEHLREGTTWTPSGFAAGMRDHWRYMAEYADGVPRLDVCKPGENGSHATRWPLGGKTINYRWNRKVVDGEARVEYTYLVTNPVVWLGALGGILLSLALLAGRVVFGQAIADRRGFLWIALFTGLYLSYFTAILQIERVMYLYHYFLPLSFALLNLGVLWHYLFGAGLAAGRWHPRINLLIFLALAAATFLHFAPLTYGWSLSTAEVEQRAWLDTWRLEPVR